MPKITRSKFASLFVAAAFLSFATTSCKKTDVQAPKVSENTDELRQFIMTTTGETNVTYSAESKDFIIDNDARMTLEDAKAQFAKFKSSEVTGGAQSASGVQQQKSYYSVSRANAANINIYADASVPAVWVTAIDAAIVNWNNVNSLIHLTRTTNRTIANTIVTGVNNGGNGVIAQTYYPNYYQTAGKSSTINTYYNYLPAGYQVYAMTHEFGHAFGFGHTNSTYGYLIAGTPNSDGYSIMNTTCKSWSAFSSYDLLAIKSVYPK